MGNIINRPQEFLTISLIERTSLIMNQLLGRINEMNEYHSPPSLAGICFIDGVL